MNIAAAPATDDDGGQGDYIARVDARLTTIVADGASSFDAVLRGMQGADPVLVLQRARARRLSFSLDLPAFTPTAWSPQLHPLRSEWYFTAPCAARLAARFGPSLVCLGAPTVAAAAGCALVDCDDTLLARRFGKRLPTVHALDLGHASTLALHKPPAAIVVDPPWYDHHPKHWFHLAANAVRAGGRVAVVVPPVLQRPSAPAQRDALQTLARKVGPTRLEPHAVEYQTPQFEQIAMRAANVPVSADWRTADLLIATVNRPDVLGPPSPAPSPTRKAAETFVIGDQLVMLGRRDRPGVPALQAIGGTQDFVWDRISRRDPRIGEIDLWTSRSRVATVAGRPTVRAALAQLAQGASTRTAVPDSLRQNLVTVLGLQ